MNDHRLGRDFKDLPIEEQVRALRDHAIGQELLIHVLLTAIERLGVDVVWRDDGEGAGEGDA